MEFGREVRVDAETRAIVTLRLGGTSLKAFEETARPKVVTFRQFLHALLLLGVAFMMLRDDRRS